MKIKKILKIILIDIFIFTAIFNINISYADENKISNIITGADDFLYAGKEDGNNQTFIKNLKENSNFIYKILMVLGISVAVIISVILGIKFMIGSVEEKAQIKDQLVPFTIGCVAIFGAFSFWSIMVNVGNKLEKTRENYKATQVIIECESCGRRFRKGTENVDGICPYCAAPYNI